MGRAGRLKRLGSEFKRINEAKTRLKEIKKLVTSRIDVKAWFYKLPVNMEKETFVGLMQNRISGIGKFKHANRERQARYLTIVYETITEYPSEKINPKDAIEIGRIIEKKLNEYDSENTNQN